MKTFASLLQVAGLAAVFWAVWTIAGTALFLGAFGIFALLVGLALRLKLPLDRVHQERPRDDGVLQVVREPAQD